MPIEKRKSHSTRYRASLAQNIAKNGFVVMPCSWCASQGLVCKMIARISVAKPAFVEVVFTMALAYRFLPRELSEKLARLRRLRQQKEFLVEKGADMVARGLSTLDELEEVERQETPAIPSS
ncbi:hypothetical protein MYCTH_105130 [Thermothelomyces thermophilus ATCC 42464]|uniref:Uncharacterized protein n=1 Tax=Thermothelomyces thermophilus (strain ATCC 42464 / BCRC 31852 / DSM 1799) TaxID=573729 RepID=G2QLY6_THET4|nr:uncharacterized protein MYCTH_105130 [Thermothelomyces thermophilus ATCC 42464]AEO60966.1 hypothetical protein MYCTH_105130 [Thermothelomyces thermophilus ATCC 42464]